MIKYSPKITTSERDGKIALWVNMPSGNKYNICDLRKKYVTQDVLYGIARGIELGMRAVKDLTNQYNSTIVTSVDVDDNNVTD